MRNKLRLIAKDEYPPTEIRVPLLNGRCRNCGHGIGPCRCDKYGGCLSGVHADVPEDS